MKPKFDIDFEYDEWEEQKEQQRLEDNYWGKGSEPIKKTRRIKDGKNTC